MRLAEASLRKKNKTVVKNIEFFRFAHPYWFSPLLQAVSVASAISDRICIHSNKTLQLEVSAKNLMACDPLSNGCEGGIPLYAWMYWKLKGLVTGGPYDSKIVSDYTHYLYYLGSSTQWLIQRETRLKIL